MKKVSSTETTIFVYDGDGQMIAEYSTVLATTQQVSYMTADHLGSPRVVTNENGTVVNREDYSAFGERSSSSQRTSSLGYPGADEIRKGYTGYEKDDESGLDFAQARYYSSVHGRYTSIDPMTASATTKNPQTFNRYSYVLNSPYKFVDPLGLIASNATRCRGSDCPAPDGSAAMGNYGERYGEAPLEEIETTNAGIASTGTTTDDYVKERREYTFTVTQTNQQTGVVSQIKLDVVEEDVDIIENNVVVKSVLNVAVKAENGPSAQFKINQAKLDGTAAPAATAIIENAILKGFDKGLALAIAAKETFFGVGSGSAADATYNPMQYRSGLPDGRRPTSNMSDNIAAAMDLYRVKESVSRSTQPAVVLDYYRGRNIQPTYASAVLRYRTEIQQGISSTTVTGNFRGRP
ncbi:MAG: hypothetical protein DMF63_07345 [Acidobacteria bacterium]|nr:MAG: hypothetical protein DMF63_07345 [Acidobacteriota bacterium]